MTREEKPLVSIIAAVYNIAEYLPFCLDSIAKQTYKNLEVILIDDGSTDGSGEICDEWAQKNGGLFKKVLVKHFKNSGLSAARNRGIKLARGKYIAMIDGDDMVEPNFVKVLLETAENNEAEIAVCGFRPIKDHDFKEKFVKHSQLPVRMVLTGESATVRFLIGQQNLDVVTWNKLYLRSLFLRSKIKFPTGKIFEDKLTTYKLYYAAEQVAYTDEILYNYRQHKDSIMNNADMKVRLAGRLEAAREATKFLKLQKAEIADAAKISEALAHIAYVDNVISRRVPKSNYKKHRDWLMKNREAIQKNPYCTDKIKIYLSLLSFWNGNLYRVFRTIRHE